MPTAIERWRTRGAQERAEKRRARLRKELPMGAYVATSGVIRQEYNMIPDGEGGYTREPKPKPKRKKKNPFKKLFGMEE